MMQKQSRKFIILLVITLLYISFIWSNSIMTADISSVESEGVRAFINGILRNIGIEFQLTSHITRKLAHFSEFALLGFLSYLTISNCKFTKKSCGIKLALISAGTGLLVAITDECIQIFSPGRACQIKDMCIDFSGVLCGIVFFVAIRKIIKLFKRKGDNSNGKNSSEK